MERDEDLYDEADASEQEDTPDPLAEIPEDHRQKLEEYLAAERERLAAEAREAAEAELKAHREQVGARLKERVRDFAGIEFDENNQPVLKDPNRVMGLLAGAQQKPAPEDPEPDPVYDPEGYRRWAERQAERKAEERLQPLQQQVQRLERLLVSRETQGVAEQAREQLERAGFGQWAEHPQFQETLSGALSQLSPEQLRDPRAVRFAAFSAVGLLDEEALPKTKRQAPPQGADGRFVSPGGAYPNPARQGLSQTAPPRGYGRQGASTYTDEERHLADLAEMSVDEYRRYSSEETAWG